MARRGLFGGLAVGVVSTMRSAGQFVLTRLPKRGRRIQSSRRCRDLVLHQAIETLELRQMLAGVTLTDGVLQISGADYQYNTLTVTVSGSNYIAKSNSISKTVAASSVKSLRFYGGNSNDNIRIDPAITKGAFIDARAGSDNVYGGGGSDTVWGDTGNDTIYGNNGNDYLYGEDGNDKIDAGGGWDNVNGGSGTNSIYNAEVKNAATSTTTTPPPTTTSSNAVSSFTLFNADTDKAITTLSNGATIDFSKIGTKHVSIVANTASGTKSVRFGLDSNSNFRTESSKPFAIVGDASGNLAWWTPSTGSHTLTGTPFTGLGATGSKGPSNIIKFTVTNGTTATPSTGGVTPSTNVTGAPEAVITAMDSSINADQAIHVQALSSKLNGGTPLTARYQWNFGDSGSDYNSLDGFNAAHVYETPGTYNITLTVTNQGRKSDSATLTVRVGTPSRKVYYVSNDGSDSADGSLAHPFASFAKANAALGSGGSKEIHFRAGDVFTLQHSMNVEGSDVVIGRYGDGANPILKFTGALAKGSSIISVTGNDVRIDGLTFDSRFTSGYEGMPTAIQPRGSNLTATKCTFLNLSDGVNANSNPRGLLVQDSNAPLKGGVRGYFVWMQGSDFVLLGNSAIDSAYQHVIRATHATRVLVAYNDFTNDDSGTIKSTINMQDGSYYYIDHNNLHKGKVLLGPLGDGDGLPTKDLRTNYLVFEDNKVDSAPVLLRHGLQHAILRNNIITLNGGMGISIDGYNSQYGRGVVDATIVNNTGVNTGSAGGFIKMGGNADGLNVINNLYLAKNLITGSYGSSSMYVADSDLSSFDRITNNVWAAASPDEYAQGGLNYVWPSWSSPSGYRTASEWNGFSQVGTDYFEDPGYSSGYAPNAGTTASDAATAWGGVFVDINGKARPVSGGWSAGAVEV